MTNAIHRRGPTHRLPGLVLTDHEFDVPLDHARPDAGSLTVFAREAVAPKREDDDLPWLVFFQGGPGYGSPRPVGWGGWIGRALEEYRLLLLDQRGTGRSSPISHLTLAGLPDAAAQAEHLTHYRADAIVSDAELIRAALCGDEPWAILGQSYGGFCALRYLSAHPEGLSRVLITGGLPSLSRPAEDVYHATYPRIIARNERYYDRYPSDIEHVRRIVGHLQQHDVRLPNGDRLSPRRLQQLGLAFGMSDGFETVHYLLEEAFVPGADGEVLSDNFLHAVDDALPYETHLIFSILHEAAYCQGEASRWAAQRVLAEFPGIELPAECLPEGPVPFTGEMIYPWMFEEYRALRPLAEAAQILAEKDDWAPLYDLDVLAANPVPCAAVVFEDDMYVERRFSMETADQVASLRVWHTNEYDHNALRADGKRVLGRLLDLVDGYA